MTLRATQVTKAIASIFALAMTTLAVSIIPQAVVTVSWEQPTNQVSDDLVFYLWHTNDLTLPFSQWPADSYSATNVATTNLDGGNRVFSVSLPVQAGANFFVVQGSNFWGLSPTSNLAYTPSLLSATTNLKVSH